MEVSKLAKKLHIRSGDRAAIVNAPPGLSLLLRPLPQHVDATLHFKRDLDFILLFVRNAVELRRLGVKAIRAIKHDGMLWMAYPKKSSNVETDITRDVGWDLVEAAGLECVAQIAIDQTWSGSRFRPKELIGKSRKS
jgi:hypothetical protein